MHTIFESPSKDKKTHATTDATEKRTRMTPLTAYAVQPDGIRFETQEEEEKVILFLRQHPIVLLPSFLLGVVLVLAPSVFVPLIIRNLKLPIEFPPGYLVVGTAIWYLGTFGILLSRFLRWFFNIYIVSNERLVDIDFIHLLYKEFSEARLSKVQDITYKTGGVLAVIFNFGNVLIQTAGQLPNFEFELVPSPDRVVRVISDLVEKARNSGV
jgi:uncharacterized membrane protein YdbT with pleckstrin-like domain